MTSGIFRTFHRRRDPRENNDLTGFFRIRSFLGADVPLTINA
jgi:hypothetical protein